VIRLQKGLGVVAISSNSVVSHPEVGISHSLWKRRTNEYSKLKYFEF
jgi:hypothetical protein